MNIFLLEPEPQKCIESSMDAHVKSTIREAIHMLGCVYPENEYCNGTAKNAHRGGIYMHPVTIWIRESEENFKWTVKLLECAGKEFKYRQKINNTHKSQHKIDWIVNNYPNEYKFPNKYWTEPARCFGALKGIIKETDSVYDDYRMYYNTGKLHLAKWSRRRAPDWFCPILLFP